MQCAVRLLFTRRTTSSLLRQSFRYGCHPDWVVQSFGSTASKIIEPSFSREKTLYEVLLKSGMYYIRPLGRGTFGRVVLARAGEDASSPLMAVKIARSSGSFTQEEAHDAEAHLQALADFAETLPEGFVKQRINNVVLSEFEEQLHSRSPVAGEYRLFNGKMVRRSEAEQAIWAGLEHPFVGEFLHNFKAGDQLFLVSRYYPGGTFKRLLSVRGDTFGLDEARFYAAQLCLALAYLQSERIAHRDVKPENILLDSDGNLILIDFGLATRLQHGLSQFCGTANYLPPEVLLSSSWAAAPLDWWALGVIIFEIVSGYNPFAGKTAQDCFNAIITTRTGSSSFFPADMDPVVQDLIMQLLQPDPGNRLCAPAIFAHPFFDGVEWKQVFTRTVPGGAPFIPENPYFTNPIGQRVLLLPER